MILVSFAGTRALAQGYPDRPISFGADNVHTLESLLAPLIKRAQESYPAAKKRFTAGLPKGHQFHVVVRLVEGKRFEQVFVRVESVTQRGVKGRIASDPGGMVKFRAGDPYEVADADILDWVIARADGTEEGNLCGKAIDAYQAGIIALIYRVSAEKGEVKDCVLVDARDPQQQHMVEIISDEVAEAGRKRVMTMNQSAGAVPDESYSYVLLDFPAQHVLTKEEMDARNSKRRPAPATKG